MKQTLVALVEDKPGLGGGTRNAPAHENENANG